MSEVIVVGGGAAGMMAAIAAAKRGHSVRLVEKNEKLGKKLFLTGKGRCNLTNACGAEDFFRNVVHNPKFLYSSFYGFTNFDMMELMEENRCHIKVERGGRVFPASDKSSDVIRALSYALKKHGARVMLNTEVLGLLLGNSGKSVEGVRVKRNGGGEGRLSASAVILATGGLSYPDTGSTGDGYRFAREAGHTVTGLSPALTSFISPDAALSSLKGLSLKNVNASFYQGKQLLYEGFGEMLFTHFGVSGPLALSASSYAAQALRDGELSLSIDLKPALGWEQLDVRILRDFEAEKNRQYKNALDKLLPASLIPVVIARSGILPEKRVNEVTREERHRLIGAMKDFRLRLVGLRGYREAVITQGGVQVREVSPSTMESKIVKGLYFAGEMLDLDALTGGYNLQIAWSTGHLAGSSVP